MAGFNTRRIGSELLAVAAALALLVSIYDYFAPVSLLAPTSRIAFTGGAMLVIVSTALLLIAGLVLAYRAGPSPLQWFFAIAGLLDIAGTAFAGYMLNSWLLVILMAVALVGWVVWLVREDTRPMMRVAS